MGLLTTLWGKRTQALTPGPADSFWYGPVHRPTTSGVAVDENTALNYSAVWAATRIIAETCATLPLKLYRRLVMGGKEPAPDHSLYRVIHSRPNPEMDAVPFWEGRFAHAINWGNGFAEIERTVGGKVIALWPVHPSRIPKPPERDKNGKRIFKVRQDDGRDKDVPADSMFHIVGPLSDDGLWGKGVISQARESIGMGMATEQYGAAFFGNGASASIVLKHPQRLTEAAATRLRSSFASRHQGPGKAHGVAVLEEGMDLAKIDYPPEDIQFLTTRQHNIIEISRWYRLPPHVLGDLTRQGYSSLEQENISLVVHSFRPSLVRVEKAINRQLLTDTEVLTYFAEFLVDALLRGDTPTRTAALMTQFLNGAITIDEWREIENRNPTGHEKGSQHFVPLNLTTLDRAGEPAVVEPAFGDAPVDGEPTKPDSPDGDLLDVQDFRQEYDYDCGCAATHSVCDFFGVGAKTNAEYITELGANEQDGTQPERMVDYINDQGLITISGPGMTLDDLRRFFKAGMPVICPVQMYGTTPEYDAEEAGNLTGHYVVVIGIGLGMVFIQDPSAGRAMIPEEEFDKIWHDIEADGVVDDHFGIAVGETVMGADEEETPDEVPAKDGKNNGYQKPMSPAVDAVRGMLDVTVARLIRIEANEARRAAKHPVEFLKRLDAFYDGNYAATFRDAIRPCVVAYFAANGWQRDVAAFVAAEAERHITQSREDLLTAAETSPAELAERVELCLRGWEGRTVELGE